MNGNCRERYRAKRADPSAAGKDAGADGGEAAFVPEAGPHFVPTPFVEHLVQRASIYLDIGYPVHFAGFAGTGKSTIGLYVAARRGHPAILMHGDAEFSSSDLVGPEGGYASSKAVDNFVGSVVRSEEKVRVNWNESSLTIACREGIRSSTTSSIGRGQKRTMYFCAFSKKAS